MAEAEVTPEAPARPPRALSADRVGLARRRGQIAGQRARIAMWGITGTGRVAGRVAARLPDLPRDARLDGAAIDLLLADDALAEQILDAAAAALRGHDLAAGIDRAARDEADAILAPGARAFGLAHRRYARDVAGGPIAILIAEARAEIAHLWADRLPAPLGDEFRPAVPRPMLPPPKPQAAAPEPKPKPTGLKEQAADAAARSAALYARARKVRMPWQQPVILGRGAVMPEASARAGLALDAALKALLPAPAAPDAEASA